MAFYGDLHPLKTILPSRANYLVNSNPSPLFAPVTKHTLFYRKLEKSECINGVNYSI